MSKKTTKKIRRWELIERFRTRNDKFFTEFALDYLSYFGNDNPSKGQVEAMEDLLEFVYLRRGLHVDSRLTDREKMCLHLSAQGRSLDEIAEFFAVTRRVVELLRKSITTKLECKKITQAIALGIRHGVIG
jgi:DNA-binding CsgD family transcriptional regulator